MTIMNTKTCYYSKLHKATNNKQQQYANMAITTQTNHNIHSKQCTLMKMNSGNKEY